MNVWYPDWSVAVLARIHKESISCRTKENNIHYECGGITHSYSHATCIIMMSKISHALCIGKVEVNLRNKPCLVAVDISTGVFTIQTNAVAQAHELRHGLVSAAGRTSKHYRAPYHIVMLWLAKPKTGNITFSHDTHDTCCHTVTC